MVEISLLVYRNYNSDVSEFLQSCPFENDLNKLFPFIGSIRASGGWGFEALEAGLQALNNLDNLSHGVLIGDAGGNTHAEITEKRKYLGEDYWNKNGFPKTTQEIETDALKSKDIPIHTCYIGLSKTAFEKISKATRG